VEHIEEELNALHKEKLKNEEMAKKEFEERIRETKKKAILENIENAKKSGNVLTQTMDEEGNLVGVKETVNFEDREVSEVESTQLRNELLMNQASSSVSADA
jgi:predicted chitinase